jgi:endonuclease YncB( thermonuclease family)
MYKIKVNEKLVGGVVIALGLAGLLAGLRWSPETAMSGSMGQSPAPLHQSTFNQAKPRRNTSISRQPCRVLTVYDGDTIGCDLDGNGKIERPQEEIRLLGIDTPERSYSRKNPTYGTSHPTDEPYAKASSEWMERQVSGKSVYLEYDLRQSDRYGRTLAFVYPSATAKKSLNEQAVTAGYAMMLFLGKNRLYEDQFIQAEQQARQAKRGLWGLPSAAGL